MEILVITALSAKVTPLLHAFFENTVTFMINREAPA